MEKIFVGIDVSKDNLDVALLEGTIYRDLQYSNDHSGIKGLLKELPSGAILVMESSGPYHLRVAYAGFEAGFEVSVVNPLSVKRYCQMKLMRTKTDKADARAIAEYAKVNQPKLWEPPLEEINHLQQLDSLISLAIKQRTQVLAHQSALVAQPNPNKVVFGTIRKHLAAIERAITKLENEIDQIVQKSYSEELAKVTQIPGIGRKTAIQVLIVTQCFQKFDNCDSLVAYAGLCPRIYQSGKNQRSSFPICKLGQARIRSLLYMCALTAKRSNPSCKALFDRLVDKGKHKKVALIAVAAKLLRQAFAIGTTMTDFQPNYIR